MTDKNEERILLLKVSKNCGFSCEALGSMPCKKNPIWESGRRCRVGVSRSEAVKIMANAIDYLPTGYTDLSVEEIAEAALDALLEVKDVC